MKGYLTSTTLLIGLLTFGIVDGNSSIPRSNRVTPSPENRHYPPWNPSPSIDEMGFLMGQYTRVPGEWEREVKIRRKHIKGLQKPAMIRQVPGDGNCLFHSISMCYAHAANGTHVDLRDPENLEWLYENSACLREKAVNCLEKQKLLFLQGTERVTSENLVQAASQQYGISGAEYCKQMRQNAYWGGGPEIVALCNVLQRPIHVYELHSENNQFYLKRMACFGSPRFDRKEALHILSADSRFPDLIPGRQMASGNHFLAMFPVDIPRKQQKRIRGGGDAFALNEDKSSRPAFFPKK